MRDIEQRIEVVAMVRLTHTVFPQRAVSVAKMDGRRFAGAGSTSRSRRGPHDRQAVEVVQSALNELVAAFLHTRWGRPGIAAAPDIEPGALPGPGRWMLPLVTIPGVIIGMHD